MKLSFASKLTFLTWIAVFIGFVSLAQNPVANFSASNNAGCSPLIVSFSNQSTGNPTSFKWILGNGTISTLENPTAIYTNPGQYNVKLIVQNNAGIDSILRSEYITVYAKPTVNFNGSSASNCINSAINFSDSSIAGSGNIVQRLWDFGDGTSSNLSNPVHSYNSAGYFNVSLKITNSNGCIESVTRTNYIHIFEKPTADFSNTPITSCTAPLSINFLNTSTSDSPLTYYWNFGDGNFSTNNLPLHTYNDWGTYSVTLKVTNSNGCIDSIVKDNLVRISNLQAMFSSPNFACIHSSIQFQNNTTPAPQNVLWNFGDGTTSVSNNPVKQYSSNDTFYVKLIVQLQTCKDSIIKKIIINDIPNADFSANPVNSCKTPLEVDFHNESINAVNYWWSFGDSSGSTDTNPSHIYDMESNFSVSLIAENNVGCRDTVIKNNFIKIKLPTASVVNFPQPGCAPLVANLQPNVSDADSVISYHWNFGDGFFSNVQFPNHTYQNQGKYDITLNITTANGCTDTVFYSKAIVVGVRPNTSFSADPRATCASTAVTFTDLTPIQDSVSEWLWLFGDGASSTLQNPQHNYVDTTDISDAFDVTLIVNNNGCRDTLTMINYIQIYPPIADFYFTNNCTDKLKKSFIDNSKGADSWLWNFGDGFTSVIKNPVHNYTNSGFYNVTLIVFNNVTGCSDTTSKSIVVINESPDFMSRDTSICKLNAANFNLTSVTNGYFSSIRWDFGNGQNGLGYPISNTYYIPGIYDVTLYATDINGCKDTVSKNGYIKVNGPYADFYSSTTSTCKYASVEFSDNSLPDGRNPIKSWIWSFGDGMKDTTFIGLSNHYYVNSGSYTVTLEIMDSAGCKSSIPKNNLIFINNPHADFQTIDTGICPNSNANFINLSSGNSNTYLWNFGDGNTSLIANPTHSYNENGVYSISLISTNSLGCSDTIRKTNYIHVSTPVANFTVSDSIGNCPPLIVTFSNHSQNYSSQYWSFGDNTSTLFDNPSHFYSISGNYTAKLIVTANGGCVDSIKKTIIVHGPRGDFSYDKTFGCAPTDIHFNANAINTNYFIWDFSDGNTNITTDSIQLHSYSTSGNFMPKLLLKDSTGCVVTLTKPDTIKIYSIHAGFQTSTHLLCDAGIVQFNNIVTPNDDIISQYDWLFGDGTIDHSQNPAHLYNDTGTYSTTLIVNSAHGCTDTAIIPINVHVVSSPRGMVTQSPNGCAGISIQFIGSIANNDTSAISWSWDFGNGAMSNEIHPNPQVFSTAGTYPVTAILTNSFGCRDTVNTNAEAYPYPTTNAGSDTTLCSGRGINLHAEGADEFIWSPSRGLSCTNCANPITNTDSVIIYTVTGKTNHGCIKKDSIWVDVKYPFNLSVSERQSLCLGSSKKINASGAEIYTWYPSTGLDNNHASSPNASPSINTTYQVIGSDSKHCFTDTAYVPVIVYNYPVVDAGEDKTINVGQSIELIPRLSSDVTNIKWTPTANQFRNVDGRITVKPNETTTYEIEVSNAGGCKSTDAVTINVLCNGANLYMPNTFSPNHDGMNDVYYPRGTGIFSIKSLKIFSRWGEIVFERNNFKANDASKGWDGIFKGQPLGSDVFVYIVEVQCDNNSTLTFKGDISLLK